MTWQAVYQAKSDKQLIDSLIGKALDDELVRHILDHPGEEVAAACHAGFHKTVLKPRQRTLLVFALTPTPRFALTPPQQFLPSVCVRNPVCLDG
jgi:hypothetical protein